MKKLKLKSYFFALAATFTVLFAIGLFSKSDTSSQKNTQEPTTQVKGTEITTPQRFIVSRVIDGDTIELESGEKVRYIGIDTPESVDPRKSVQCFGKESTIRNEKLVKGKEVRLEKDVSNTDKYGRLLRYVYVDGNFVNKTLVEEGYAKSSSYPPDIKYQDIFKKAETQAREKNLGLWGECETNNKTIKDQQNVEALETNQNSEECIIKGNISSKNEKIYHIPGCQHYNATKINNSRGERWFCTEQEAIDAGWRKALDC